MPDIERVTFTIPKAGLYLPSIRAVLPAGRYDGRVERVGEKLLSVTIHLSADVLRQMGVRERRMFVNWNITQDYQSGLIRPDRES